MGSTQDIFNVIAVVILAIFLVYVIEGLEKKTIRKLPQAFSRLFHKIAPSGSHVA
jgi:uncharacterized protein YjeT (DUF2065 family)